MINVGIIGAGAIASVHAASYKRFSQRARVAAVCDVFKDKAEAFIAEKAPGAIAFDKIEQMLADPYIDAVSICLPPNAHASVAEQALRMGKHVLVEKPMASSLEECDAMIRAARESGKLLSVVSQNRFKTPVARIKRMIDGGDIGKVVYANFDSLWWRGQVYYDLWWRGTWEQESGGCFMSHAVHYLDLMHMLLGMPKRVQATIANVGHNNSECEDVGSAVFDYGDKLVQFNCSLVSHGERQSIRIEGEKGSIAVPWELAASCALPNGFPQEDQAEKAKLEHAYNALPELLLEGHDAQISNFLGAIEGVEPLIIDGAEGRKTLELVMGIYKSAVSGQPVDLPIVADDAFYKKATMVAAMPKFNTKTKSVENFSTSEITLGRNLGN